MKDYLKEFTRFLATSFCEFEAENNVDVICKTVRKSNLDAIFDEYSFVLLFNNKKTESFFSLFRILTQDSINENDHAYAMRRFIVVETIKDSVVYGYFINSLFKESKWYQDCLKFANKVVEEFFDNSDYTWKNVFDEWKDLDEKSKEELNKKLFE